MRGLLKAALLLEPVLSTSFVVTSEDILTDRSSSFIDLEIPSSHDGPHSLGFRLDVLPSENACGRANVTIDDQSLYQTVDGEVASGEGSITLESKNVLDASWSFKCIKVNGQPDSQLLEFVMGFVDGRAVHEIGFSALFRQTGSTEIIHITTESSVPDGEYMNPDPERLQAAGQEDHGFSQFNIEQEMDELHWLKAQQRELEFLIFTKEQAIAELDPAHFQDLQECGNLDCVAKVVMEKARKATHHIMDKFHSHKSEYEPGDRRPEHRKHENHTCGLPEHGNHTAPPRWKKPHYMPLPICRYPPPPRHGRQPPHCGPRGHGELPPPPPESHHNSLNSNEMSPPLRDSHYPHDGPDHEMESQDEDRHGSPYDEMRPHDEVSNRHHSHDQPHGPAEAPLYFLDTRPAPLNPSTPFDRQGPQRPHHISLSKAFHITKFVIIGMLFSFLMIALHRRVFKPITSANRRARREERCRRRAFRRATRKYAITRFFARIFGHKLGDENDEEKGRAALVSSAEEGMSTTMTEEITELQNAAEMVNDMVIESSRHSHPIATLSTTTESLAENRPLLSERDYDSGSQIGDGEELPAYEDNDGSEMSSVIADGFRYTPGSSEYSPARSPAGSVSDILGSVTKH